MTGTALPAELLFPRFRAARGRIGLTGSLPKVAEAAAAAASTSLQTLNEKFSKAAACNCDRLTLSSMQTKDMPWRDESKGL